MRTGKISAVNVPDNSAACVSIGISSVTVTVAEKGTVDLIDKPVNDNEYNQQLEQYKIIISELGNNKSNNKEMEIEMAKEDRDYE